MKFRAWDKVSETMHKVEGIRFGINGARVISLAEMNRYNNNHTRWHTDIELLQSTGLFDKNGKEIFEGHIVKDTDGYVGYIAFLKQEMGYVVVYKTYDKRLGHRYRLDDGHLEILGNIYEHPHLLGEDTQ